MDPVYQALANLMGKEYVSNQPEELYIYSFDLGTAEPCRPQYVVSPRTTEHIRIYCALQKGEDPCCASGWRPVTCGPCRSP